tara:strand:- start:549 stop:1685 length:1137 start_codon:yes stop_codon:yes gene_type:complete
MATFTKVAKPKAHHDEKTWAGSGSTTTISGLGFQPDWFHIKKRNATADHSVTDTVRGLTKNINFNNTDGEDTATLIASATSDGCTLTGGANEVNASGGGYIGHFFKLASSTTTNDASSTGVGTIDSTFRANTDSGISVVKWTGTGANGTIAHGLGAIPDAIIVKDISQDGFHWEAYWHGGNRTSQGNSINETDHIQFFNDGGVSDDDNQYWNDTAPTSTVFSVGDKANVNESGQDHVAIVIANTNGSVRCGHYQGNGNVHGSFIFTGFKPRAVWIKRQDSSESTSWKTSTTVALGSDNSAQTGSGSNHGNTIQHNIKMDDANNGGAEVANQDNIEFYAQGFRPVTTDGKSNLEGAFYLYVAWADEPSVSTNNILGTAF